MTERREEMRRLGVMLTEKKAEIFDRIEAAGDEGITSHQLLNIPLGTVLGRTNSRRLKSHIHMINVRLEETNYVIKAIGVPRRDRNGCFLDRPYKLVRRDQLPPERGERRARLIQLFAKGVGA